ncbi:hypothetical protein EUTSA_v10002994mg [Eutrema salsugineum]|uniref:S-protein homolog n=1 Tax=Eutrema salsugineum TaxID=72664 RepID=V4L1A0_EUTSA|nr:hypothetical protein EUTSA_v10002994mg [Eutrema salsugineum]
MNHLSCSLFIIALCIGLSNANKKKNSVHFKNSLGQNNILRIHCISDEDDPGYHHLSHGQTYDCSFYDNIAGRRISCDLWQGLDFRFHAKFMAYKSGGLILRHGKKTFGTLEKLGFTLYMIKQCPS